MLCLENSAQHVHFGVLCRNVKVTLKDILNLRFTDKIPQKEAFYNTTLLDYISIEVLSTFYQSLEA